MPDDITSTTIPSLVLNPTELDVAADDLVAGEAAVSSHPSPGATESHSASASIGAINLVNI